MILQTDFILKAALSIQAAIITHKPDIEVLDQAIGDGDHFINVLRGADAIVSMSDELTGLPADEALNKIAIKFFPKNFKSFIKKCFK